MLVLKAFTTVLLQLRSKEGILGSETVVLAGFIFMIKFNSIAEGVVLVHRLKSYIYVNLVVAPVDCYTFTKSHFPYNISSTI